MTFTKTLGSLVAGSVLSSVMLATGCTVHAGYRAGYYYDPYYHHYYAPAEEDTYIVTWENETHRTHADFQRRKDKERREYWQWRHQHGGDRDHDHDKH
ncbi:MAG TPA: hypothetical protein VGJ21_23960 [Terracidiphilus sp.]